MQSLSYQNFHIEEKWFLHTLSTLLTFPFDRSMKICKRNSWFFLCLSPTCWNIFITYWYIYLNKFQTNQNNVERWSKESSDSQWSTLYILYIFPMFFLLVSRKEKVEIMLFMEEKLNSFPTNINKNRVILLSLIISSTNINFLSFISNSYILWYGGEDENRM